MSIRQVSREKNFYPPKHYKTTISCPKIYPKVYPEQETTIIDKTKRPSFLGFSLKLPSKNPPLKFLDGEVGKTDFFVAQLVLPTPILAQITVNTPFGTKSRTIGAPHIHLFRSKL